MFALPLFKASLFVNPPFFKWANVDMSMPKYFWKGKCLCPTLLLRSYYSLMTIKRFLLFYVQAKLKLCKEFPQSSLFCNVDEIFDKYMLLNGSSNAQLFDQLYGENEICYIIFRKWSFWPLLMNWINVYIQISCLRKCLTT